MNKTFEANKIKVTAIIIVIRNKIKFWTNNLNLIFN